MKIETITQSWDDIDFNVFSYNGEINDHLKRWLLHYHIECTEITIAHSKIISQNQTVEFFLQVSKAKRLCFIDADMHPTAASIGILTQPGDLVYCGYPSKNGCLAHYGQEDFGTGCARMSREMLQAIDPPYFKFHYNDAITVMTMCECRHFTVQAREKGYSPEMVGTIGHIMPMTVEIDPADSGKLRVANPQRQHKGRRCSGA